MISAHSGIMGNEKVDALANEVFDSVVKKEAAANSGPKAHGQIYSGNSVKLYGASDVVMIFQAMRSFASANWQICCANLMHRIYF